MKRTQAEGPSRGGVARDEDSRHIAILTSAAEYAGASGAGIRARDRTRNESNLTSIAFAAKTQPPLSESSAPLLALMEELESSLAGSYEALLKLDLAGIEQGTSHQAGLIEKLDAIRQQSENGAIHLPPRADELWAEIHRSRTRIMQAARLQSALLARAQLKLRVLANMLAGPSADYGPLLDRRERDRRR